MIEYMTDTDFESFYGFSDDDEEEIVMSDQGEILLTLWKESYKKTYGVSYKDGESKSDHLTRMDDLMALCDGDMNMATRAVKAMFTDKMNWCTNVSLAFLTKEANFTKFIVPVMNESRRSTKTDWKAERSTEQKVRIRTRTKD